ncbi:MAG: hypothetical protein IIY88_03400 [Eubacterium sp.]|nr:hypothetical protein [Eubacterium sp.]
MRRSEISRALFILAAAALLICMFAAGSTFSGKAYATEKYRITVSGGLHGTVNGKDKVDVYLAPGTEWNPNDYTVEVTDDKYYFKGFHVSGIEGTLEGAQAANEDRIYVADYGIKGDLVMYTIRFVDDKGKTLMANMTAYGKVGDKPVIAYRYIDGYLPETYNLTKTLSSDEDENVFTFKYSKNEGTVNYEEEDDNGNGGNGAGGNGGNGAAGGNGQNGANGNAGGNGQNGNDNGTDNIQDLDDNDTPMTDGTDVNGGDGSGKSGDETIIDGDTPKTAAGESFFRPWMFIPLALLIVIAIGAVIFVIKRGKQEE